MLRDIHGVRCWSFRDLVLFYYVSDCVFFFFFKQKTAYEMRISDWSSDVCSSDLDRDARDHGGPARGDGRPGRRAAALFEGRPLAISAGARYGIGAVEAPSLNFFFSFQVFMEFLPASDGDHGCARCGAP